MQKSTLASDLVRNRDEYSRHWKNRFRKTWNYSSQGKLKRFRKFIQEYRLGSKKELSVFDQGFGLGLMLFSFDTSSHLAGLELSDKVVQEVSAYGKRLGYTRLDLRIFDEKKTIASSWPCQFDIVISSHVLEHIANPEIALRDLLAVLKPGGLAVIVVPINELPGEDLNHFFFLSQSSLVDLVCSEGMTVSKCVECDYVWDLLAPLAYRLQRRNNPFLKLVSFGVNGITAILPLFALEGIDSILQSIGYKPRQVFLIASKR